jgi:hypothetical protein
LELHLGRSWRGHDDLDIGICRQDLDVALAWLAGWDFRVGLNNVWVRRSPDEPWAMDLTIGAGDDREWVYRRDPTLSRPWDRAVLLTDSGIPYLAPDLQLLFKAKDTRPKDDLDSKLVIPELDQEQREFLVGWLPGQHAWREMLPT